MAEESGRKIAAARSSGHLFRSITGSPTATSAFAHAAHPAWGGGANSGADTGPYRSTNSGTNCDTNRSTNGHPECNTYGYAYCYSYCHTYGYTERSTHDHS